MKNGVEVRGLIFGKHDSNINVYSSSFFHYTDTISYTMYLRFSCILLIYLRSRRTKSINYTKRVSQKAVIDLYIFQDPRKYFYFKIITYENKLSKIVNLIYKLK